MLYRIPEKSRNGNPPLVLVGSGDGLVRFDSSFGSLGEFREHLGGDRSQRCG